MFHVEVFSSAAELNRAAFAVFADVMRKNEKTALGLATGSTPLGLYKALCEACAEGTLSFRRVQTFNLDE